MQIEATRSCSSSKELLDSLFAKADTNGDNSLSIDEFSALISNLMAGGTPADNSGAATDETSQENETAKAAAFADFDSDSDGQISEAEMKAGLDNLAKTLAEAVNAHNAGDSTSLVELLFGKQTVGGADGDSSKVGGIGATHASATDAQDSQDLDNNGTSDATDAAQSLETRNRRLQQWMLDAFAAQFSVTAATLGNASANSGVALAA